jgi:hypothetical protein
MSKADDQIADDGLAKAIAKAMVEGEVNHAAGGIRRIAGGPQAHLREAKRKEDDLSTHRRLRVAGMPPTRSRPSNRAETRRRTRKVG